MTNILEHIHGILWGVPALLLIISVGVYLTIRTNVAQLRLFPDAVRRFFALFTKKGSYDATTSFRALCTALAATVGTGNLVGVAGAICLGGPGSIFWMWISGFLGMATKYSEVILAQRYKVTTRNEVSGGPMYIIAHGMEPRFRFLANAYCLFGLVAAFGVGNMTQVNAMVSGIRAVMQDMNRFRGIRTDAAIGLVLAVLIGISLSGGSRRIGSIAEILVPFASLCYIVMCIGVLIICRKNLYGSFSAIFRGAFSPAAVTGGMIGSAFRSLRVGCARGVFTNEAGMGTASIAHAAASVSHPVEQGLMGIMEVFLDTIVICTMTALAILSSGIPIPYGHDFGGMLTMDTFTFVYGEWISWFLSAALCLFAFATVLGWGFYGAKCAQFLFGQKAWGIFTLFQTIMVIPGAILNTGTVWLVAEILNGMMAIPNLIALSALAPEVVRLTKDYIKTGSSTAGGGTYADFYQCKPL